MIIDLSKVSHRKKAEYLSTLLPLLVTLRRRTGLPHKILLDEAHHYLSGPDCRGLIDPELAGYILVTYRISGLSPSIRMTSDAVVMVTRETDRHEAETLLPMCRPKPCATSRPTCSATCSTSEAALLPGAEEAHGGVRRFQLAPRLTAHVRHRTKYLDMPVLDSQAFVFTAERPVGAARAHAEGVHGTAGGAPGHRSRATSGGTTSPGGSTTCFAIAPSPLTSARSRRVSNRTMHVMWRMPLGKPSGLGMRRPSTHVREPEARYPMISNSGHHGST